MSLPAITNAPKILLDSYTRKLENLNWHMAINQPTGEELAILKQRIADIEGFINDLRNYFQLHY